MNNLKSKTTEFLSALEGYHQVLKEIHWSTENKSEHLLTDDMNSCVLDFQDRIAEYAMGRLNTRFGIGDLKTLLPSEKTVKGIIEELEKDILSLKTAYGEDGKYAGMHNILDDFLEKISTCNYFRTLK